jgi:hypothetical protein
MVSVEIPCFWKTEGNIWRNGFFKGSSKKVIDSGAIGCITYYLHACFREPGGFSRGGDFAFSTAT